MAKDSNKTAGALKVEKRGSMLSGLLADENEFDRRALWRIGWWGAAAVAAVMVAVLANQAALGSRRDRVSASDLSRQAQLIQSLARETQNESHQLAAAVETLNTDRDRLYARITVLEQGLDSVTGALAKQSSAQASAGSGSAGKTSSPPTQASAVDSPASSPSNSAAVASAQPSPAPAPGSGSTNPGAGTSTIATASQSGPNATTPAPTATPTPPALSPVATTAAVVTDRPRPEVAKEATKASPTPMPATSSQGQAQAAQAQTPPASASSYGPPAPAAPAQIAAATAPTGPAAAPLVAPRSIMAPPDPAAAKLTEPDKLAKVEAAPQPDTASAKSKSGDAADTAPAAVQRTEFAVDLGGANSLSGLRALWRGLTKTHTELAALRPIIMLKEGNTGLGMQLRLGAGPLNDAAAAARICARLAERQHPCETTVYDGQHLAIRGDDRETPEAGKETAKETAKEAAAKEAAAKESAKDSSKQPAPGAAQQPAATQKPAWPQRHRSYQQRHGAREEPPAPPPPPPPPPETSTLSSLFHRQ
jgi:hypothetical protein